jgi:UDP-glucose 4-epimerase
MRVAVTGGAGFIGTHTVEALVAMGATVLVLDDMRHASPRPMPAQTELVERDVASPAAREALLTFRPEAILHLAAQGGVNRSWREPAEDARCNVMGTVSVLQAGADAGSARVVIASSGGALYGNSPHLPSREEEPPAPRSPYGTAKLAAEAYLRLFTTSGPMSGCALRYGNVYGPGQDGSGEAGVVAISCRRLLANLAPEIRGDGMQTRDFVYVSDVAEANVRAVTGVAAGAINVGTGIEASVLEVIANLCRISGAGAQPVHVAAVAQEVRRSCLDVRRARDQLGWRATTALESGLALTYASFREEAGFA